MSQPPTSIFLDEQAARRVVLAEAIETSEARAGLLSTAERAEINRLAVETTKTAKTGIPDTSLEPFLEQHALHVLRIVENRNPALASLQAPRLPVRWLAALSFFGAVLLGAATDRVANPHRIDLLSLPLLAIIVWNTVVYGVLVAGFFLPWIRNSEHQPDGLSAPPLLSRWVEDLPGRAGRNRIGAAAVFLRNWRRVTAALTATRFAKLLHLAAAGWALGLALSLFTRGLVVEYRVGWESTFLDAAQVHAILQLLLMPAMALFPFQPFSAADIAGLRFDGGGGAMAGARWVYIYAALLLVVVIVPRLVLALHAGWRERQLARRVVIDLRGPYFQRLAAMLNPARVQLALLAIRDDDREALLRVLRRNGLWPDGQKAVNESLLTLVQNDTGETLCVANITNAPEATRPPPASEAPPAGWASAVLGRLQGRHRARAVTATASPIQTAIAASEVVLFVLGDAEDIDAATLAFTSASGMGKPLLLLVNAPAAGDAERMAAVRRRLAIEGASGRQAIVEVLSFERFARNWIQDPVFLDALARCMPDAKKDVFARLADVWIKRNDALFAEAMQLAAAQLLTAAREVEEVPSAPAYFKRLTSLNHRQADAQARQDAIAVVAGRLQQTAQASHLKLLRLYGVDDAAGMPLEPRVEGKFDFQAPVNAAEAGLAGAATGAASGASIDLVTGGLSLGIATALGAVIGGGAAFAGAAWKNRATPAGKTLVQLSDEMLQAMAAASLLRYLAIADYGRSGRATGSGETAALWETRVVAAVEAKKETFTRFWPEARARPVQLQTTGALGNALQTTMRLVLDELYLQGRY